MRLMWLGMTLLGLLYGSTTASNARDNETAVPLYDQPLYNNELSVALPEDWRLVKSEPPGIMKYDDIVYHVQLGSRKLVAITLTNNGDFSFADDSTSTNVKNNEIWATEYRRDGVLTNVVVKAPCGGFWYVWMWPMTKDPSERRQAEASMKSIKCLASPRPQARTAASPSP